MMNIRDILSEKGMTIYRLSKISTIAYATLNDICNDKVRLEKCTAETVFKIAHSLGVSMEELLAPCFYQRSSFENFKSTVCHRLKELGDLNYIEEILKENNIRIYYERKWYPECLYLLAMLDYLSRENEIPVCSDYDDLRIIKLEKPVYPAGVKAMADAANDESILKNAEERAIPEFKRFNIIESEIREVA